MFGYCSNSILAVGDPVKVIGPECNGQVGELAMIDEEDVYGVWLDTVGQQMFFSREEIERLYSPAEIQANLAQFFQDVGLYLLKEAVYGRVPGLEIKVNMVEPEKPHSDACLCDECAAIRFAFCGYDD